MADSRTEARKTQDNSRIACCASVLCSGMRWLVRHGHKDTEVWGNKIDDAHSPRKGGVGPPGKNTSMVRRQKVQEWGKRPGHLNWNFKGKSKQDSLTNLRLASLNHFGELSATRMHPPPLSQLSGIWPWGGPGKVILFQGSWAERGALTLNGLACISKTCSRLGLCYLPVWPLSLPVGTSQYEFFLFSISG